MDQAAYIESTLQRFGFSNSNDSGVSTPMVPNQRISKHDSPEINNPEHTAHFRAVVGSLLYLANWTRPDICFAVGELSKVLANPGPVHLRAAHRLLCYLKRTSILGITYSAHRNSAAELNQLWGYCDADWGGDPDSFKSIVDTSAF